MDSLLFERPGGPELTSSSSSTTADEPLIADHPEIPAEFALQGFDSVRATRTTPRRQPRR